MMFFPQVLLFFKLVAIVGSKNVSGYLYPSTAEQYSNNSYPTQTPSMSTSIGAPLTQSTLEEHVLEPQDNPDATKLLQQLVHDFNAFLHRNTSQLPTAILPIGQINYIKPQSNSVSEEDYNDEQRTVDETTKIPFKLFLDDEQQTTEQITDFNNLDKNTPETRSSIKLFTDTTLVTDFNSLHRNTPETRSSIKLFADRTLVTDFNNLDRNTPETRSSIKLFTDTTLVTDDLKLRNSSSKSDQTISVPKLNAFSGLFYSYISVATDSRIRTHTLFSAHTEPSHFIAFTARSYGAAFREKYPQTLIEVNTLSSSSRFFFN